LLIHKNTTIKKKKKKKKRYPSINLMEFWEIN